MMIAILLDAGKDLTGKDQKLTMLIDQEGRLHEVRTGWPAPREASFHWGPVLRITTAEYLLQLQIALEVGI